MGGCEPSLSGYLKQCGDIGFCGKYCFTCGFTAQLKLTLVNQQVSYGDGFSKASYSSQEFYLLYLYHILGTEYLDTVTIAPGATISQQAISVASSSDGFSPLDGVLA